MQSCVELDICSISRFTGPMVWICGLSHTTAGIHEFKLEL